MASLKVWIQAARLRTLPLAFSTILLGTFLAAERGYFTGSILILCLLTTLFLQVLSNFANDYGDSVSGVDGDHREGPSRTIQDGLITRSQMKLALFITVILTLISGLLLIYLSFGDNWLTALIFFMIGIASIAAAIKYTVGSNPYGYAGLGDIFVFLFFGIVGVAGSYYLYANQISWEIMLPASSCGLLSVGVLNVNNIRDIESDKKSGKRSIPVRLGKKRASIYHAVILLSAMILSLIYSVESQATISGYLYLLSYPLIIRNGTAVIMKSGAELDPFLRQLAISTLLYVILFGVGLNI